MKPTIGRTVHYTSFGTPGGEHLPEPRAAIITAVHSDEDVALAVLNPAGLFFSVDVPFSEGPKPGHWNWPPREASPVPDKRAFGGVLPCAEPAPGDVAVVLSSGSVEYVRPTSPIPDDAADRLRYLSRAPRKRSN